jgi:hypothetical protein
MKTESSRRMFLQTGLILPAAGFVIPSANLAAAFQQPAGQKVPKTRKPLGYRDSGKYGKYVIKEPYIKHHQLEDITVGSPELMADCIITHQVFYKPEVMVKQPHAHDFVEILSFIGTNPMNCREFEAEVEFCLGEEREPHIITVPTVVSLAKGLLHGPIDIKKVDKPFIFLEVMLTSSYSILNPKPPV